MSLKWPKIAKNGQIRPKMCKNRFFSKVWTSTHQSKCLNELCRFKRSKNSQIDQTKFKFVIFWYNLGLRQVKLGVLGGQNRPKMIENRFFQIDPELVPDGQKSILGPLGGRKDPTEAPTRLLHAPTTGQYLAPTRQNSAKMRCFGRISRPVRLFLSKHPKLKLAQRVEHVYTPREAPKSRICIDFQHFMSISMHRQGKLGVLGGQNRPQNGRKIDFPKSTQNWSPKVKGRFWALSGVGKTQIRPLRDSYTHLSPLPGL